MVQSRDRRRWDRSPTGTPYLGVGRAAEPGPGPAQGEPVVVDVFELTPGGALLAAGDRLDLKRPLALQIYDPEAHSWLGRWGRVVHARRAPAGCRHLTGVEFLPWQEPVPPPGDDEACHRPLPADIDRLTRAPLLRSIPRGAVCPLLNVIRRRRLAAGERLMTQGEPGDTFYVIQEGSCVIKVEDQGRLHVVNRLHAGEVVGEMAVLTGEPRSAHVDAETSMELWELGREEFEAIARDHPDLRNFLTEIVTQRFESRRVDPVRIVGKYLVRHKLGAGGWSIVFAGHHQGLGMPVAIKMLKHNMAMDEEFLEKFRQEARVIAGLNHPNIVRVYDIEELFRTIFIVMEHLEGQSLEDRLRRRGPLDPEEVRSVLRQVLDGLAYAHGRGVVHQDIKPGNLFLLGDGQVKIVDFGLACPAGSEDLDLDGTLQYMAPEQIEGDKVTPATDLYCLGLTAWELLTGKLPYQGLDLSEVARLRLTGQAPDPGELAPDIPPDLADFIRRVTAREPGERPRDAAQALAVLGERPAGAAHADKITPQRLTSLVVSCPEDRLDELGRLLDHFDQEAAKLGAKVRTADLGEI